MASPLLRQVACLGSRTIHTYSFLLSTEENVGGVSTSGTTSIHYLASFQHTDFELIQFVYKYLFSSMSVRPILLGVRNERSANI